MRKNNVHRLLVKTYVNTQSIQKPKLLCHETFQPNSNKEDLVVLHGQPPQIFADFCKLAWNFLTKNHNMKLYQAASNKLQVDVKKIQSGVESLAYLFIEAKKYEVTEEGFNEALSSLGLPTYSYPVIYNEYTSQRNILDTIWSQSGVQHHQYNNLEWRFETQVSSKSLKNQIQPRIILKLDLVKNGNIKSHCLQSDIPNIIHLNQLICQALQESKTHHSKRIQHAVM